MAETPPGEARQFHRVWDAIRDRAGERGSRVTLDLVCQSAATHLGVDSVAVSVSGMLGAAHPRGSSGRRARELEELQNLMGEGPSLEGLSGCAAILVVDLAARDSRARWPFFASAAAELGVGSLYVKPIRIGFARFGVLALYLNRTGGLDPDRLAEAGTFAAVAQDLLLLERAAALSRTGFGDPFVDGHLFDNRPELYQAAGPASVRLDVDLATAFLGIRTHAFTEGLMPCQVAADELASGPRLDRETSE